MVPVAGVWLRHMPAGKSPLRRSRRPRAGRWQPGHIAGLYLAGDVDTVWAEWYRHLAECEIPPLEGLPRDLWKMAVHLGLVADLSTAPRLTRAGLPAAEPTSSQWPVFQALGARLADEGVQGILYASAARTDGLCLCVFRDVAPLFAVRPLGDGTRIERPPAPPTGMRT